MKPSPADPCPCGSGQPLARCCDPILKRTRPAETAAHLMRSRFTAHVLRDYEHLHRTYTETAKEPYVADPNMQANDWTRLVIHAHEPGPRPDTSFVDFTAYYKEGDAEKALHEKAAFQRIDGAWMYTGPVRTGPAPIRADKSKVGRNDPCPCGSGKKSKNCCAGR